jgi:hypothetical protein
MSHASEKQEDSEQANVAWEATEGVACELSLETCQMSNQVGCPIFPGAFCREMWEVCNRWRQRTRPDSTEICLKANGQMLAVAHFHHLAQTPRRMMGRPGLILVEAQHSTSRIY